jgi:hypothetical protein
MPTFYGWQNLNSFARNSEMITSKHTEQVKNILDSGSKYENELIGDAGVRLRISGNLVYCLPAGNAISGLTTFEVGTRNPITEFTRSSASRLRRYLRESVCEYKTLITLTYPSGEGYDGKRAKRDLATLLKRARRMQFEVIGLGRPSWFWFMEFQDRGSIHFHLFTNQFVPKGWLSESWYTICGTEDGRHLQSGTRVESIKKGRDGYSSYASKYASKHEQKSPPVGFGWVGRFWGVSGDKSRLSADVLINGCLFGNSDISESIHKFDSEIDNLIKLGYAESFEFKREGMLDDVKMVTVHRSFLTKLYAYATFIQARVEILMPGYQDYETLPETDGDIADGWEVL